LEKSFKVNKSEYVPNNTEKYGNSLDKRSRSDPALFSRHTSGESTPPEHRVAAVSMVMRCRYRPTRRRLNQQISETDPTDPADPNAGGFAVRHDAVRRMPCCGYEAGGASPLAGTSVLPF
jgi:hypothetical protein